MFDAAALKGFVNTLSVNITGLTADAARAAMVTTAVAARDRVINEARARSGATPSYRQIVDGADDAPLEAVTPDGYILFAWRYNTEVAALVRELLVARSPIDTGEYIAGIITLADGQEVDYTQVPPDARQIQLVGSVPYARRLEVGKRRDGTPFVVQVPPHIFEETTYVARRLWGDVAQFDYNYVDLNNAYALVNPAGFRKRGFRKGQPIIERHVRYPCIFITPRQA